MSEAVARIAEWIESGTMHQIVTANLDFARNARENEFLHRLICECSMVLPDGAPLLWAARMLRRPLKERVTGVDLIPQLAKLSAERGYGIYLLGSNERNSRVSTRMLKRMHPNVRIVGSYAPETKPLEQMDDDEMLRRIHAANPDILLVAFGNPEQEIWIARNFSRLQVPVAIGIGGSLDMLTGSQKRVPKWIENLKMEGLAGVVREPKRLKQHAHDISSLLRHLPGEILANRMQPDGGSFWPLAVEVEGNSRLVRAPEILTGKDCSALVSAAEAATEQGQILIIDMVLTTRLEADGIGCLIEARRIMMVAQQPVWLTGVSQPVRDVLKSSALFDLFRTALTPSDAMRLSKIGLPHPDRRKGSRSVSGTERSRPEKVQQNVA